MTSNPQKTGGHMFSIQLKSKDQLKIVALPLDEEGNVLIEGFLGKLESLGIIEGVMLEINGANGSLRMDFAEEELGELLLGRALLLRRSEATENKGFKHEK